MKVFLFLSAVLLAVHLGRTEPVGVCPADNGASDILLPDSDNCAIYYQCDWGEYVVKRCAATLHFNDLTDECDYPEIVNCDRSSGGVIEESEEVEESEEEVVVGEPIGSCPEVNPVDSDVLLPDSINCGVFYKCDWGEPVLQLCPDDLLFNTATQTCDWPDNVNCDRSSEGGGGASSTEGNSGFVPDPLFDCPETEALYIPDKTDCTKFYVCVYGEPVEFTCPDGLYYDGILWTCNFPDQVTCGLYAPPEGGSVTTEGGSVTTEDGGSIDIGEPIGSCPEVNPEDSDVLLPDSINCGVFYKCDWGEPVLQLCPDDLLFNTATQTCDWPDNVNCDRSSEGGGGASSTEGNSGFVPDPLFDCPETEALYIPDKNDCTKFYVCVYGEPVEFTCPDGLHYDGILWTCNFPDQVTCGLYAPSEGGSVTTEGGSVTTEDGGSIDIGEPIGSCPEVNPEDSDVLLPDSINCGVFYKCDWGVPVLQLCPDDLLFNTATQTCDWPDNVNCDRSSGGGGGGASSTEGNSGFVPDPLFDCPETEALYIPDKNDCTKFYVCVYGEPVEFTCPDGLYYDGILWTCNFPDQVTCGLYAPSEGGSVTTEDGGSIGTGGGAVGSCPAENGVEDTLLPDAEECSIFYKCNWGEPVIQYCTDGLVYNAELGVCDWPDNVNCDRSSGGSGGGGASSTEGNSGFVPDPLFDCPETEALYIPDKNDCTKFYICVYGVPVELTCPDGLHYDGTLWTCNFPDQVTCGLYAPIEDDGTSDGDNPTEDGENPWLGECPAEQSSVDVYLASKNNPHKFYVCVGTTPVELECPSNLVFDVGLQRCEYA